MGVLVVTGFVVAKHVNRILAISSYYEHRQIRQSSAPPVVSQDH